MDKNTLTSIYTDISIINSMYLIMTLPVCLAYVVCFYHLYLSLTA